ncbi:uncharacterized protein LOC131242026 [Magnolia sinica]|uniref:uncharacterized protein LOC131242026 n=1 Tax=Magnolia sinica TaxID=86752 RepID=UPI0026591F69|nr:uncharacterized protein LOC131242026 [Magnolia sinica]
MYKKPTSTGLMDKLESKDEELDIKKMLKEIELLGSPHMSWKERKALKNQKVVTLGGKPPKKQRMPLSVASVMIKKQKEREQKVLQEAPMLTESLKHRNKNSSGEIQG